MSEPRYWDGRVRTVVRVLETVPSKFRNRRTGRRYQTRVAELLDCGHVFRPSKPIRQSKGHQARVCRECPGTHSAPLAQLISERRAQGVEVTAWTVRP